GRLSRDRFHIGYSPYPICPKEFTHIKFILSRSSFVCKSMISFGLTALLDLIIMCETYKLSLGNAV
ncbi:MAG: hypothetical protein L0Y56_04120, partial [Nitrospira sp.]|nr:hypothetical protein [Nitrospira sp.]